MEQRYIWEKTSSNVLKIDTTFTLNIGSAKIYTLSLILEFIFSIVCSSNVHEINIIWKVLGASNEQLRYSVEYKLNSLYHDFDSTFYTADWFSTDSYFLKTWSQHFSDKGICLVWEDTYRKWKKKIIGNPCSFWIS